MRSKMSINGHPRIKEPRPSIANQDRTFQTSRHNQGLKIIINSQQRGTSNSTTMPSNTITTKVTRLNTLSSTIQTTMRQDHQRINQITTKPSRTMVKIRTKPGTITRTIKLTTRVVRTKTSHNLTVANNSNSKEIQPNNPMTLLKIDCTSFWRTCWLTCTMARDSRSIVIITPKLSAFLMNRKRSKKWTEKTQWLISIHCSICLRQRLKISWAL